MECKEIEIIFKEIPYKIESCIVYSAGQLYISLYKELTNKSRKKLIEKGLEMVSKNITFFIE